MEQKELSPEEELKLWNKYRKTRNEEIRDILVLQYAPLVKYVAGKIAVKMANNVEFDDLVSYGIFGLFDAIEKFAPEREIKFKTYAVRRIQGAIYDELRYVDWVSRPVRTLAKELDNEKQALEGQLGRSCTNAELAKYMGLSEAVLHKKMIKVSGTSLVSLDEMRYTGDENDKVAIVEGLEGPSGYNPDVQIQRDEMKNVIREAIMELPENSQRVLVLYYFEDLTLKEIGTILKVTESRVSQLHTKAIEKLRIKLTSIKKGLY